MYKVLLTGQNEAVKTMFFEELSESFTCVTSSERIEDLKLHLDLFQPDIFAVCLGSEDAAGYARMNELRERMVSYNTKLVLIGEAEACELFQKHVLYMTKLTIDDSRTANEIQKQIYQLIEEPELPYEEEERKTILIIDDDTIMLKVMKDYLHDRFDVATAVSGKIAYKYLEMKKADLILLDYEMPNENGPQVLEKLRTIESAKNIPVIFLTGMTEKGKIQKALYLKPQGYLLKPVDKETLIQKINEVLQ